MRFSLFCLKIFLAFCCIRGESAELFAPIAKRIGTHNEIGYLRIDGQQPINEATALYVKYALEDYKQKNVTFILLHLDTPGGEVFAAMKIAQMLYKIAQQDQIPVVALIDHWAVSAGAMLAYASEWIVVTPTSVMGAAEPVTQDMKPASEKVNSALRAEFSNLASLYGRDPLIAEAMVDKQMILVRRQDKIIQLQDPSEILPSDELIARPGKLLTLNAESLVSEGIAALQITPTALAPITADEEREGRWPARKNLLFHAPFFDAIPHAEIITSSSWKIGFFTFLSHPLIGSLLLMGLIIGAYIEMSHPGFGLPGIVALVCLGLLLLSGFAAAAVGYLEVVILGIGVLLLAIEIFVLPGFGWTGGIGILFVLGALFALTIPSLGNFDFDGTAVTYLIMQRVSYFIGALLSAIIIIALLAKKYSPRLLQKSRFIARDDQEGYTAVSADLNLIGKTGIAATDLRPSGYILVEERLEQALSISGFIEKDVSVKIVRAQGAHLVVQKQKRDT